MLGNVAREGAEKMKISTKGRYALRMMLDLAVYDTGEPVRIRDIAEIGRAHV